MCYQTRLIKKKEEIQKRFQVDIDDLMSIEDFELIKAFDFPKTPIITNSDPNKLQLFQWGLVPEWAQDTTIKKFTLNARIETLNEKPSFKDVIHNRCLIIADGFYEWQWLTKSGSQKQKYLITIPNEDLFAFAGVFSEWIDFDGNKLNSYSMVTTEANELMHEIHNTKHRMPIILKKEDEQNWLQGENYTDFKFPYTTDLIASVLNTDATNQLGLF